MTTALNLAQLLRDADAVRLEQQGLPAHFAAECDAHTRETYATFLAALLLLKGEVSATESRLFKLLLGALKLGADSQAKLLAQAQQIDQTKLTEFCRLAKASKLTLSFMLDALILCRLDRPLSAAQSEVLSEWADTLSVNSNQLSMLGKLAAEVLGLPNDTPWALDLDYSSFCVWSEWLELPLTEATLKAGIRGGRWLLEEDLTVYFPWTMDGAVVCFANQATLSTVAAEGQVTIRNSQLWLPRLNFDGAMKLAVTGVQVSGQWHEATDYPSSAFVVNNLAQCAVEDSTFNTPNRPAIYITNTPAQLQGCRFVDCGSAETVGGGLYAINGGQLLEISGSEFLRCAGREGGGIWVRGDATLTTCQFIDCTSAGEKPEEKGRSAAGYFNRPLVDTLKQCQFVRSSVRASNVGEMDKVVVDITFCTDSTFTGTECNLYHDSVDDSLVVDESNTFTGGAVKRI